MAPHEVEVRVRLGEYRTPPAVARRLSVAFVRQGETVRVVSAQFAGTPPLEWRQAVSLPAGDYDATVNVELDDRLATREDQVQVQPGEPVYVKAPIP